MFVFQGLDGVCHGKSCSNHETESKPRGQQQICVPPYPLRRSHGVNAGHLEPMCQQEEVLEIGATMVEVGERREIYRHHHEM
jgi:hypothetical protein